MKKRRNTKKALLGSLTMMLLCFALLLGTTFAWFTDTVSSSAVTIKSGNLDVGLEYALQPDSGTELAWQSIPNSDQVNLFGDALWEPGYTGVVYLRVKNTGSLALKYQYTVDIIENTLGKNKDGDKIDLTNYLELAVKENLSNIYSSRDAAKSSAFNNQPSFIHAKNSSETVGWTGTAFKTANDGTLKKGETSKIIAVVVHMPLDVGNEANHSGEQGAEPSIKLQVNLKATQYSEESDSFNNEYDIGATYPTVNQTQNQSEENQT